MSNDQAIKRYEEIESFNLQSEQWIALQVLIQKPDLPAFKNLMKELNKGSGHDKRD